MIAVDDERMTSRTATENDPRWTAVVARDRSADGTFFYSVRTTGVYCRPSCAARRANPRNVAFHLTAAAAEEAGFRPCKRCKPEQPSLDKRQAAIVAEACRAIAGLEEMPGLSALARSAGLSLHHFHRTFKAVTGLTPREYAAAHRGERVRQELKRNRTITRAIYQSGFNSGARFYAATDRILGMTPTAYRKGGADNEIHFAVGETSLGALLVATSTRGVCAIALGDDPETLVHELQDQFPRATLVGADPEFEETVARVVGLVEAPALGLDLPLDVRGTAFQQRVWQALREVPAGSTITYSGLAQRIGAPDAVRAVASACAANPLAVAIPCHRVIRTDGTMSGYRWGVDRKRKLLAREGAT
jgi:AraC family transcriptional regulator of adaptative response/methylated-DNA-[protein]-cysteine methyltransferase